MKESVYEIDNKVRTKIFSYLEGEWTSVYEKAFLFDNKGKLRDKWVGTEGSIDLTGVYEGVEAVKNEGKSPILIHTHPSMMSFSDVDFTNMIINNNLTAVSHWIATKNINFLFVPKTKTFLHGERKTIAFLRTKRQYIKYDKEASKLLKEKAFDRTDFPNAYKYFWNLYVAATVTDFMGADFAAIPLNKKGEKYCKLMKKGLKVLSGLELKIS